MFMVAWAWRGGSLTLAHLLNFYCGTSRWHDDCVLCFPWFPTWATTFNPPSASITSQSSTSMPLSFKTSSSIPALVPAFSSIFSGTRAISDPSGSRLAKTSLLSVLEKIPMENQAHLLSFGKQPLPLVRDEEEQTELFVEWVTHLQSITQSSYLVLEASEKDCKSRR